MWLKISEKQEKGSGGINLGSLSPDLVAFALQYLETGVAEDLWKFHEEEVQALLKIVEKWRVLPLKTECEDVLCRYITFDNMQEALHTSFKMERWTLLERGIERFNQKFSRTILSGRGIVMAKGSNLS